jgi:hypothetical protein
MNLIDYLSGWRRHNSYYVNEAISRRDAEGVRIYFDGINLMLKYKSNKVVFTASYWYTDESYEEYIQRHVDIVLGLREDPIL